jgi:hypothetical protein
MHTQTGERVRFVLTIETNDPAYTSTATMGRVRASARVAELVRQAAAELDAGWGPDRDMTAASGLIVGHWTYEEGVTK